MGVPIEFTDEELAQLEQETPTVELSDEEISALPDAIPQKEPSAFDSFLDRAKKRAALAIKKPTFAGEMIDKIPGMQGYGEGTAPAIAERLLRGAAGVGNTLADAVYTPIVETAKAAYNAIPEETKQAFVEEAKKDPVLQQFGTAAQMAAPRLSEGIKKASPVMDAYKKIPESLRGTAEAVGEAALNYPGEIAAVKAVDLVKGIKRLTEKPLAAVIKEGVSKGIKPTVVGKKTLGRYEGFYDKAEDAVKTIAENRDKINVVNEAGEAVPYPRTAAEAAQAIEQAKKLIYTRYNDMARASGEAGAVVDIDPVIKKLDNVASYTDEKLPPNDPRLNWTSDVRAYAKTLQAELEELRGANPEIIESRIKDLNESLKGFYLGRTEKAKAQIDASVANALREQLDKSITEATGSGYQALKNQYGALKTIEGEMNHRAIVNARKSKKGLFDISDVFTGSELAAGILTANPALLAKAAAGKGITEWLKELSRPDRYIEKMFRRAYRDIPTPVKPEGYDAWLSDLKKQADEVATQKKYATEENFAVDEQLRKVYEEDKAAQAVADAEIAKVAKSEEEIRRAAVQKAAAQKIMEEKVRLNMVPEPVTPEQEQIAAMRRWQTGKQPDDLLGRMGLGSLKNESGAIGGLYSNAERAVQKIKETKAPASQWKAMLDPSKGLGTKVEENDWIGLNDWLASHKDEVLTKDEVAAFVGKNKIMLEEVVKGDVGKAGSFVEVNNGNTIKFDSFDGHPYKFERNDAGAWDLYDDGRGKKYISTFDDWDEAKAYALDHYGLNDERVINTKFSSYQIPGGSNYREVLVKMPEHKPFYPDFDTYFKGSYGEYADPNHAFHSTAKAQAEANWKGMDGKMPLGDFDGRRVGLSTGNFNSSHWDEPNVLAHYRLNDRVIGGKKALFVEEIQSDWHQAGRDKGYAATEADKQLADKLIAKKDAGTLTEKDKEELKRLSSILGKSTVPNAPFKKTWQELAFKSILDDAAKKGYDKVAWTTGADQAARYDLSKQLSEISYSGTNLKAFDKAGKEVISRTGVTPKDLPELIGKDASEKLVNAPKRGTLQTISGLDLQVGGEGMKSFYDLGGKSSQNIANFAQKYGKKWGATVKEDALDDGTKIWSMDVTPQMREEIIQKGQPMGNTGVEMMGTMAGAGAGALAANAYLGPDATPAERALATTAGLIGMGSVGLGGIKAAAKMARMMPEATQKLSDARGADALLGLKRSLMNERGAIGTGGNPQIHTEPFKKWFGDWKKSPETASKVVDAKGEPLVVYHGTGENFTAFDKSKIGDNFNADRQGFFFLSDPTEASSYAKHTSYGTLRNQGSNVKPAFIDIKNPLHITDESWLQKMDIKNGPENEGLIAFWDNNQEKILNLAKKERSDGIILEDASGQKMVIPFEPNQIKSATGNSGAFSKSTDDIRKGIAASVIGSGALAQYNRGKE
jgi:hypothetical protein